MAATSDKALALNLAHAQAMLLSGQGGSLEPTGVIALAKQYEGYLDGSTQREVSHNMQITAAARVAHEANRVLQIANGEGEFAVTWEEATKEVRESAKIGVRAIIQDPDITPEGLHLSWCETKFAEGWTYAPVRNNELKQHPCLVPYEQLPAAQRTKDAMFQAVVRAMIY